jgi:hypothetical protein
MTMTKNPKRWIYSPRKAKPPKVPDHLKQRVTQAATELIEKVLKPTCIKPPPKDMQWNYLVDIYAKWHGSYFYFCATYNSPGPYAISPSFELKFTRLEYKGGDRFALAYMRHTGRWVEVYDSLSLKQCMKAVRDDPWFQP